jgi:TPP-dependent 2-oxoacid decarboxylase
VNAAGYPVATMVNAKGMVDEQHPCYIGTYALDIIQRHLATFAYQPSALADRRGPTFTAMYCRYWGQVSTAYAAETVESADAYLLAGAVFNDYTTTGDKML